MARFQPLKKGERHTLETIRARCIEDGGCWRWQAGKSHGAPFLRNGKKSVAVRFYIATVLQGKDATGKLATMCCENLDCVAPDHIRLWSRTRLQQFSAQRTQYGSDPQRRARLAAAAQARSEFDHEMVRTIRESTLSLRKQSKETGIPFATLQLIRSHKTWKETNSPWAGLMTRKAA